MVMSFIQRYRRNGGFVKRGFVKHVLDPGKNAVYIGVEGRLNNPIGSDLCQTRKALHSVVFTTLRVEAGTSQKCCITKMWSNEVHVSFNIVWSNKT